MFKADCKGDQLVQRQGIILTNQGLLEVNVEPVAKLCAERGGSPVTRDGNNKELKCVVCTRSLPLVNAEQPLPALSSCRLVVKHKL